MIRRTSRRQHSHLFKVFHLMLIITPFSTFWKQKEQKLSNRDSNNSSKKPFLLFLVMMIITLDLMIGSNQDRHRSSPYHQLLMVPLFSLKQGRQRETRLYRIWCRSCLKRRPKKRAGNIRQMQREYKLKPFTLINSSSNLTWIHKESIICR